MLSATFFHLLNEVYGTNLILAIFKGLNYSDTGARQLLKKPLLEFNPSKFIQKIKNKNPDLDDLLLGIWEKLLTNFINGIKDPDKYYNDFLSIFQATNIEKNTLPLYTLGVTAYSEAALSKFLKSKQDKVSIRQLFSVFPHAVFSQEAITHLTSNSNNPINPYTIESIILLIAALDLDLQRMLNDDKLFGLSEMREYSTSGDKPFPKWIANLHSEYELNSKESLYKMISEESGEEYENIRRRLKDWQNSTKPKTSKINDFFYILHPNFSHEDYLSFHIKYIIRSLLGCFNHVENESEDEIIIDIEGIYERSQNYILNTWPIATRNNPKTRLTKKQPNPLKRGKENALK